MAITKYIKRQDCGFKLSPGNSGESSINLPNELFDLICPESLNPGEEKKITFKIFKDDYIKAICFIISKLPLYRSSSNSSTKIDYDYAVFTIRVHEYEIKCVYSSSCFRTTDIQKAFSLFLYYESGQFKEKEDGQGE